MTRKVAGVEPGERRTNGPQTTGRDYRNLSEPSFELRRANDVGVAVPDGTILVEDAFQPDADGQFPAILCFALVPTATHLASGRQLRLVLASSDDTDRYPTVRKCTHVVVGEPSLNTISIISQLWLPMLSGAGPE